MPVKLRGGDFIIIAFLVAAMLVVPVLLAQNYNGEKVAVVTQGGAEIARIRLVGLREVVRIEYGGNYPGVILAEDSRIRFETATCPDQVCVDTGWVTGAGMPAACLPAKVLVRIEGTAVGDVDVKLR